MTSGLNPVVLPPIHPIMTNISADPIFGLIQQEERRQEEYLAPFLPKTMPHVMLQGKVDTKEQYAEGQAKKRYYQGNAIIDEVEQLCKQRSQSL